ncbi:MAG: ABC transporter ATP-binding protein [bacterium]
MNSIPLIQTRRLSKTYLLGKTKVPALQDVTLSFMPGEFAAIAGPSGSGKTTLMNLLGCLDKATEGHLFLEGKDIGELNEPGQAAVRSRKIGFIFQNFNLIPVLTAQENVEFPLLLHPVSNQERRKLAVQWLAEVGLADYSRHRPDELSGGQRQRVAIARALVTNPALILADEPTANLDSVTARTILDLMIRLNRTHGTTFLFSTHDKHIIDCARRVISLKDGRVIKDEME